MSKNVISGAEVMSKSVEKRHKIQKKQMITEGDLVFTIKTVITIPMSQLSDDIETIAEVIDKGREYGSAEVVEVRLEKDIDG